jgi:hypothetical protein
MLDRRHPAVIGFVAAFGSPAMAGDDPALVEDTMSKMLADDPAFSDETFERMHRIANPVKIAQFSEFYRVWQKLPSSEEIVAGRKSGDPAIDYAIESYRNHSDKGTTNG